VGCSSPFLRPWARRWINHSQCDIRCTFTARKHHCPLTGKYLHCLVTEAGVCEQLASGCYLKVEQLEVVKHVTTESRVQRPNYYTTERRHKKYKTTSRVCSYKDDETHECSDADSQRDGNHSRVACIMSCRCRLLRPGGNARLGHHVDWWLRHWHPICTRTHVHTYWYDWHFSRESGQTLSSNKTGVTSPNFFCSWKSFPEPTMKRLDIIFSCFTITDC